MISIFWFRRDLRLEDNTALNKALEAGLPVLPVFIFDHQITDDLSVDDARIYFIYQQLHTLHKKLVKLGSSLLILQGKPLEIWTKLLSKHPVATVYANKDYEPYARERDQSVAELLQNAGILFQLYKDQVIFEENEIVKADGKPYTVFTPYKRRWLEKFQLNGKDPDPAASLSGFIKKIHPFPELRRLGFQPAAIQVRSYDLSVLTTYSKYREYPARDATTYLSPHLRFGTVSIRQVISRLSPADETFLGELIWREFFMQILFHFPEVVTDNFNRRYDYLEWINGEQDFHRWCNGQTGYPLVDAGMRQLNQTGYMHNRVRMITASFLCKHLLIDWRWGEAYFAKNLLDFELSSNNGNWQWAAGTGCDAAPYFRVFNPWEQQRKFDKNLEYVNRWLPEYGTPQYMNPVVEHRFARARALETYKKGIADYQAGR